MRCRRLLWRNDENPKVDPTDFSSAVTGGQDRYATARGEASGTFRPSTETVDAEVRVR